jgi:succinoglycan biosynthesis protein ExoA
VSVPLTDPKPSGDQANATEVGAASGLPFVSIVLPIRNEADHIGACIGRLLDQDYPHERMEIIVVDGMSDDGTRDRLRELQATSRRVAIRVIDNPAMIVPTALNLAIEAARGDVIVRMDGHTTPATDYVSACVAALRTSGAANVGGVIEPTGLTPMGEAVAVVTSHPLGVGDAKYRTGGAAGSVDTVPFGAFRRDVFERVGLFDESMVRNQDYEMNVRIRQAGESIYLDPAIRSVYTPRSDVTSLWKQYLQYGWWRVETVRRHPGSLRWRQAVPPVFVAALVVLALLGLVWPFAAASWLIMAGAYVALVGSVAVHSRRATPARIALAFVIVHVAWGTGFALNVLSGGRYPYRSQPPRVPHLQPATSGGRTPDAGS